MFQMKAGTQEAPGTAAALTCEVQNLDLSSLTGQSGRWTFFRQEQLHVPHVYPIWDTARLASDEISTLRNISRADVRVCRCSTAAS
jgi:hypothetical protein